MFNNLLARIFGSRNQRILKSLNSLVTQVNALESRYAPMSDAELAQQTQLFRERLAKGEELEKLKPEAFAVVREAGKRVLGMRHFDVQLVGGAVLHAGKIAEMKTGEGKTLVATLPAYLNALPGKGVHIVTVNDYLARRDAEWMGRIFRFLGMTVGVIASGQTQDEKRQAYGADITYATNNELGFDYLRDNMAFALTDKVQRGQNFAVVDEVDSILIDEARTPLIISGPTDDDPALYRKINVIVPRLKRQETEEGEGDFFVDEKGKQVHLSEQGHESVERYMRQAGLLGEEDSLYDAANIILMHHLNALLRAHTLYHKDVEYIVRDGQVVIIDEFTGRMMSGRRWSDGLHQAVEAKEGVQIQQENQTLASITFQNYFRLYSKLSGMTGTADTEAFEFQSIYNLEVVMIPPNRKMLRIDRGDQVFMTAKEKFAAVIHDVKEAHAKQQPVLVGTASIETSELLSALLKKEGIRHEVLNAKQHEREAEIVAQAGSPGAVTIATNMAGRGTDIVLGGSLENELHQIAEEDSAARETAKKAWQQRHEAVLQAGGLLVVGSERHESRRIDNQLRGRSGRQGDPGATRFYLSLDDTLMRIFTPPRMRAMLQGLGMAEGEAIEHRWVTRAIETAQRKVEAHNFDIRKNLLEYDNVANDQRKAIYDLRDELMGSERVTEMVDRIRPDVINAIVDVSIPPQSVVEQWDVPALEEAMRRDFGLDLPSPSGWTRTARSTRRGCVSVWSRKPTPPTTRRNSRLAPAFSSTSRSPSCCKCSMASGASTWQRWITCVRAFTCVVMRRRTPSRNTSAKPSPCSTTCWRASSTRSLPCWRASACRPSRKCRRWRRSVASRARCSSSTPRPRPPRSRRPRPNRPLPRRAPCRRPRSRSRPRLWSVTTPRLAATTPAPAARARSTSSATGHWAEPPVLPVRGMKSGPPPPPV